MSAAAILGLWWLAAPAAWAQPAPAPAELVPPTLVACTTPAYPAGLDAGPQQVTAVLRIDEEGRVVDAREWTGRPEFVAAVKPLAASCRFTPATEQGRPVVVDLPFAWAWPAPAVNLSGVLVRRGDRLPVADATVEVVQGPADAPGPVLRRTTTDDGGGFAFRNLPGGPLVLRVRGDGIRVPDLPLEGPRSATDLVEVELWAFQERRGGDELVAVYDPRAPGPTHRTLDREQIRAIPGSMGDPMRALLALPGFARTPFEAGWLLVRGGELDDTGLYLDGVRLPLLYHMGGFTSVVHPELTKSVEYWAGAPPARYQGTSGAVNVQPRTLGDRTRAVAGVNLAWAHGFVETPIRGGAVALAARRSYLDGVLALALDPQAASIAPRFADVQGTLQVGRSTFTGLWLGDALELPDLEGGTLVVTQVGAQLQGRIPIDVGRGELVVQPWIARHGRGLDVFDPAGNFVDQQALFDRFPGARVSWTSDRRAELRLDTGFEAEFRSWRLLLDTRAFDAPGGRLDPWIHAVTGDAIQFESGIRIDTLWIRDQLPRAAPSPRSALRVEVARGLSVHAEFGRFHGIPEVLLLAGLPEGAYLQLERSDMVAAGFRARRAAWSVDGDVYHRQMANLATIEADGTLSEGSGRARGVETQVAWRPDPVSLSALYQYTRSERRPEPGAPVRPSVVDQPHRLQLLAVVNLPRSWTVSSRFRYGSGFPRLVDPFTGERAPVEALDLLTQRAVPLDLGDAERLPPYHTLDVKFLKEVQLRTWRLDVYLDVQNVYNRRVVEPFLTGFPESATTYGFGLPILPIFGVEGVWWPGEPGIRKESPASTGG